MRMINKLTGTVLGMLNSSIITSKKLNSCMIAKPFANSGAGEVPLNIPGDCLYVLLPNCAKTFV